MLYLVDAVDHFRPCVPDADFVIELFLYYNKNIAVNSRTEDAATFLKKVFAEIRASPEETDPQRSLGYSIHDPFQSLDFKDLMAWSARFRKLPEMVFQLYRA